LPRSLAASPDASAVGVDAGHVWLGGIVFPSHGSPSVPAYINTDDDSAIGDAGRSGLTGRYRTLDAD